MHKERPILFSAPMVRALLNGSKTQTRRIVKIKGLDFVGCGQVNNDPCCWGFEDGNTGMHWALASGPGVDQVFRGPYGKPGDHLWVRETWAYCAHAMASKREEDGPFVYAADGIPINRLCERWRPSIHMFRWASRITLEVTAVRVERLQDISEADALAEGLTEDKEDNFFYSLEGRYREVTARWVYERLWESINGPNSWAANPWAWVIEFKKLTP